MKGGSTGSAFECALKFLRYRARTEAEVRAKLDHLGFSKTAIAATLKKLAALHLLDDEAVARNWALARVDRRGYGPLRVARELKRKGLSQPLVRRVTEETFGRDAAVLAQRARTVLERRFRGKDLRDVKYLRRAVAFLERQGYPAGVIMALLGHARVDE